MLPNVLIIGAQKCGTSSLHRYLSLHPEASMSVPKELDFFIKPEDTVFPAGNWPRGIEWYGSHFAKEASVRGEASPNYTAYPLARGVPERAAALLGRAKIVYMVRDPIERVVSHYLHRRVTGVEPRALEAVLDEAFASERGTPASGLLSRSLYFAQLDQWLRFFPGEDVLVVAQEDLMDDRVETLRRVFGFLGIDPDFESPGFQEMERVSHAQRPPGRLEAWLRRTRPGREEWTLPPPPRTRVGRGFRAMTSAPLERPVVDPPHRKRLEGFFAGDVERLRAHTGRRFARWSI